MRQPAEGTILTVAREMAHKIVTDVAHSPENLRLGPTTSPSEQDALIAAALERAVIAGQDSVKRGPELLAALRDAGVVDAGGYGLTIMFAGVVAALRGDEAPALDHYAPARITHPEHSSGTYRFCTNFAVTGDGLSAGRFIEPLEELGDSVLVVGDSKTLKVHLHTDSPELATAVFAGDGEVSRLDVADMRQQVDERDARLAQDRATGSNGGRVQGAGANGANGSTPASPSAERRVADRRADAHGPGNGVSANGHTGAEAPRAQPVTRCGALAVVSGDGLTELFVELGVHTLDGGPTLESLDLRSARGDPRGAGRGGRRAAQQRQRDHGRRARGRAVREGGRGRTHDEPAGGARGGGRARRPTAPSSRTPRPLKEALARVRTGAIAPAARDDAQGRFAQGEAVGFVQDEVVAWGDPTETLRAILAALAGGDGEGEEPELISVLAGEGAPLGLGEIEQMTDGAVELELRQGGQPAYWWLLAAE